MKVPWLNSLSPRRRKLVLWSVGLLLFYTIAGFFIAPPIVRSVAAKQIGKELNREVTIAKVKLNPFAMSATIRGFLIQDKDGKPFVSWDEVYANFEFWSLFTRTYVFKEINTSHPFARVQVNPDRSLNFSDILEKIAREAAAAPKDAKPSRPLALRVDQLKISAARLAALDLTMKRPFTKFVGPLDLTLEKFATNPDNRNPYSFAGSTEEGERFSWSGHFFLSPIRSVGDFTLENIPVGKYGPLHEELVQFEVRDGHMDVRASYHVEYGGAQTNIARLTNASVAVKDLKIAERGAESNALEVSRFAIEGVSADAFGRIAEVRSISTSDGRIAVRRNADASINLIELSKPSAEATNAPGSVVVLLQSLTNVVQWLLRSTNTWVGALHELSVTNYAVQLEDLANARPVRLDLDNIRVNVQHVSNVPGSNILADVSLRWNTNGTIRTEGEVSLFPLKADLKLALDNLEIRALDPYLDPFLSLRITQGSVGMDGRAQLAAATSGLPDVSFRGEVRVDNFATVDGVMTEDFLKCGKLRVSGIAAKLHPMEVSIKEVALHDAFARLAIASEKSNNLFAVLKKTDAPAPPAAEPPQAPTKKSGRLPKIELPTNLLASVQATLPKITIGAVTFTNAQLNYVDRSLKPGVSLSVAQVNGSISGLSTENLSRADVDIRGKVDNTAPMEITGKINPLSTNGFTDLKIVFHGIELIPTSPYSGKFLGYRLNKGKLSLDLHYELAGDKLKGQNVVTVDQLMLGDKVESPDATKLPVKLGIAILKDRSGKIELDVPVEGSLNDPEFRLGRVITRALVNVFTKIVTSPFAALGAVFGGKGEEVSYQDFAAGSAALQDANKQKLDLVAKGLFERPGLQLEIEGSVDPATDRDALRRLKLQKEFRAKKWATMSKSERSRLTPEQIELTPEEYVEYLQRAHMEAFSPEAIAARAAKTDGATPSAPPTGTTSPAGGAPPRVAQTEVVKGATALIRDIQKPVPKLPPQDLEGQLLELIEVSADDYSLLATERARSVKDYLLQIGKVEPERIFLAEKADDAKPAKGSRVYLHLR